MRTRGRFPGALTPQQDPGRLPAIDYAPAEPGQYEGLNHVYRAEAPTEAHSIVTGGYVETPTDPRPVPRTTSEPRRHPCFSPFP